MTIERPSLEDVFRAPPAPGGRARPANRASLLPTLAPIESIAPLEVAPGEVSDPAIVLTQDSAREESTDFRYRPEASDPCAFLTVYALNAAILLFAFPIGFALLVFNILGGENLRTTAHVMGLTGLSTALPLMGTQVPFLT